MTGVVCREVLRLGSLDPAVRPRAESEMLTQMRSVQPYGREVELALSWVTGVVCREVLRLGSLDPAVRPRTESEMLTQMRSVQPYGREVDGELLLS